MIRTHWSILKRLYRLISPRYSIAKRRGAVFLLDNRNWIDIRLLIGKPYEREHISSAIKLITQSEMDIFMDVGSNIGLYSILIGVKTKVPEILAFEPLRQNYNQLCANIFLNGLNGRIVPVNKALSNQSCETTIHIRPNSTGVSRIDVGETSKRPDTFTQEEKIQCIKFDDNYSCSGKKIFIKVDVEGHELQVLEGMKNLLLKNSAILQVEVLTEDQAGKANTLMGELGYRQLQRIGHDLRFTNFSVS